MGLDDMDLTPGEIVDGYIQSMWTNTTAGSSYTPAYSVKCKCRLCGKTNSIKPLCESCYGSVLDDLIKNEIFRRVQTQNEAEKVYCMQCFSHIEACLCKEKSALDSLKK